MKRASLLAATMALAVLSTSGAALSQASEPEFPLYEFAGKWDVGFSNDIVEVDSQANVYIDSYTEDAIQKFDAEGNLLDAWGSKGSIHDMAVDSQDNLYTYGFTWSEDGESRDYYMRKHASDGTLLTEWTPSGTDDGPIAIDPQDNIYVADRKSGRIQKFDPGGTPLKEWSLAVPGVDRIYGPEDIAVDSGGHVYATTYGSGVDAVVKFTNDGSYLDKRTGFRNLDKITLDDQDNLYATDYWGDSVQKFSPDGSFITKWGTEGKGDGQFQGASGVAVDPGGNAYVVDYWNDRVQKFRAVEDTVAPESVAYEYSYYGYDFSGGVHRFNAEFFVTLDGLDQGVGTKEITYEATGAQEIPSTTAAAPVKVAVKTEGKTVFTYSATDRAGNVGQTKTTTMILDKTLPTVTGTVPEAGAERVSRGATISATFSEAMNTDALSRRAFRFYEVKSRDEVPATFSYDEQTDRAILNPKEQLKAGASYRVIIGVRRARDLAYNPLDQNEALAGNQPKKWGFTVEN